MGRTTLEVALDHTTTSCKLSISTHTYPKMDSTRSTTGKASASNCVCIYSIYTYIYTLSQTFIYCCIFFLFFLFSLNSQCNQRNLINSLFISSVLSLNALSAAEKYFRFLCDDVLIVSTMSVTFSAYLCNHFFMRL